MHDAGQQAGEMESQRQWRWYWTREEYWTPLNSTNTKTKITRTVPCIRISRQLLYIQLSQKQPHEKRESEKEEGWDQSTPHMPVSTWLNESQLRSGQTRRTFRPFPFEQRGEVPQASLSSSIHILLFFFFFYSIHHSLIPGPLSLWC